MSQENNEIFMSGYNGRYNNGYGDMSSDDSLGNLKVGDVVIAVAGKNLIRHYLLVDDRKNLNLIDLDNFTTSRKQTMS